jgi:ribulose-phosphate 3-epimerase
MLHTSVRKSAEGMKIVPAILAEKFDDFTARLRTAESFADYVQIDIMDGRFVETRSFPVEAINSIATSLSFEIHLMVDDPAAFADRIAHPGLRKVIFHFESSADTASLISRIRERGLIPGLAFKPDTPFESFREIAALADTLLFLTVDPGFYGNSFRPEVLTKIVETRKAFPDKVIAVDGGVAPDNLDRFSTIGVDYVCVGSRIFMKGDPADNYRLFLERLKQL